jgi:hypothetical protein
MRKIAINLETQKRNASRSLPVIFGTLVIFYRQRFLKLCALLGIDFHILELLGQLARLSPSGLNE